MEFKFSFIFTQSHNCRFPIRIIPKFHSHETQTNSFTLHTYTSRIVCVKTNFGHRRRRHLNNNNNNENKTAVIFHSCLWSISLWHIAPKLISLNRVEHFEYNSTIWFYFIPIPSIFLKNFSRHISVSYCTPHSYTENT